MALEGLLKQFGFSVNEAKVYFATLEAGLASAQEIAKKAGVKRTTAYSVLDYLVNRGLIGKSEVRGKARYLAEPPDKLLSLAKELEEKITKALPELEAIYNKNEVKPKIVFFEGDEAIQNVYDDTLKEKPEEILEWNTDAYFEKFSQNHGYIDKRTALKIKAKRMAGQNSVWHLKHKQFDDIEFAETIIIPKDIFWPQIEVNIYNNKIAFMNYAENMSVIIESKAIADAMRQVYKLSWLGAKTIEIKDEKG